MGMVNSDSILTGINILLTIISGIGAYKSVNISGRVEILLFLHKQIKH